MKIPMLQNSSNKESASFTILFIAFNLVCLWLLLSIICPLFGIDKVPAFDGTGATTFLGPIIANYFAGKYLEANNKKDE